MGVGRVLFAFLIVTLGSWGVIYFAATEAEEPGCGLGVLGFWAVCFIGTASRDLAVGVAAFVGMIVGAVLGFVTVEAGARRS